jgi:hypothetical protein
LDQICLGPFDLQFHFSNGVAITVEGSWRLEDGKGAVLDASKGRVGEHPGNRSMGGWRIRELLSDVVVAAEVASPESFGLTFETGRRLIVFDDSNQYESFSIQPGDIFV